MAPFVIDRSKDDHYVGCLAGNRSVIPPTASFLNSVVVYKLLKKFEIMVFLNDWLTVTTIDSSSTTGPDSLVVNGFPADLRALSQDLSKHHMRVNWLGYCFQEPPLNTGRSNPKDSVNQFKRMNDMLNWFDYGVRVNPQTAIHPSKRWNRVDIIKGAQVLFCLTAEEDLKECREEKKIIEERVRILEITKRILEDRIIEITNEKTDVETRIKVVVIENRNLIEKNNQLEGENKRLKDEVARLRQSCNTRPAYIPCPPPMPTFVCYPQFNPCNRFMRRC
ncbi:hypothetical protein RND81_14G178900 [Saponaria officinalis]|uniref:Uncharacterized protein n=1 Tax=Saponaria officinalis TaxID=3572 RepID=A0AAW1GPE0_SAPOF